MAGMQQHQTAVMYSSGGQYSTNTLHYNTYAVYAHLQSTVTQCRLSVTCLRGHALSGHKVDRLKIEVVSLLLFN